MRRVTSPPLVFQLGRKSLRRRLGATGPSAEPCLRWASASASRKVMRWACGRRETVPRAWSTMNLLGCLRASLMTSSAVTLRSLVDRDIVDPPKDGRRRRRPPPTCRLVVGLVSLDGCLASGSPGHEGRGQLTEGGRVVLVLGVLVVLVGREQVPCDGPHCLGGDGKADLEGDGFGRLPRVDRLDRLGLGRLGRHCDPPCLVWVGLSVP